MACMAVGNAYDSSWVLATHMTFMAVGNSHDVKLAPLAPAVSMTHFF